MKTHSINVTNKNKSQASIDDYFKDVMWIWQRDQTERTVFDLWLHVVDHCTRLVEAVRKERPKDVMDDLADTIMWFLSFIAQMHNSKNQIDFPFKIDILPSDIIWNKYPGICPACFDYEIASIIQAKSKNEAKRLIEEKMDSIKVKLKKRATSQFKHVVCSCLSRIRFAEERHIVYKDISYTMDKLRLYYAELTKADHKLQNFRDLEKMFEKLFSNSYQVFSIQTIAFHLLEEVGEVSQAMKDCYSFDDLREPFSQELKNKRKLKLEEEIADVFSWIFALMLKIRYVYYRDAQQYFQTLLPNGQPIKIKFDFLEKISLAEIIWAKYGRTKDGSLNNSLLCTGCFKAPCACKRDIQIDWYELSKNGNCINE